MQIILEIDCAFMQTEVATGDNDVMEQVSNVEELKTDLTITYIHETDK